MAVTLKDIADDVGVSVTTVSRALAGYSDVAQATKDRILRSAADLGYFPNITAQRLRKQRTDTLGFIMPTTGARFSDPFFSEFIAGIGTEAARFQYDLLVSAHPPDSEEEVDVYRRAARGGWVDGLIVVRTRVDDVRLKLLCEQNFPFVAFGRTEDELDFPYVDEDSEAGMEALVQHFVDLGHKRIGIITPPKGLMFGRYRLRGYMQTMAKNHLAVDPAWIVEGDMTQQGGASVVEKLLDLDPRPTAIICSNDLMAIGAASRIQQRGFVVGKDFSLGGFDDIPLAAFVSPPLTTVHQPIFEIGRRTCAMLINILNGHNLESERFLLTPSLIVRESSGPNV